MIDEHAYAFPHRVNASLMRYGMKLRDYFAAQALVGLLQTDVVEFSEIASDAYRIADSMMEARENK